MYRYNNIVFTVEHPIYDILNTVHLCVMGTFVMHRPIYTEIFVSERGLPLYNGQMICPNYVSIFRGSTVLSMWRIPDMILAILEYSMFLLSVHTHIICCRGGKICLTEHFKPLWARNVPKFGIGHAMALGVSGWLCELAM